MAIILVITCGVEIKIYGGECGQSVKSFGGNLLYPPLILQEK